ncbi:restriction endonuclease [Sinisalibacter lacisalsi]|nr:restriction endonuclease [Sinisalibacter lacisalsi]
MLPVLTMFDAGARNVADCVPQIKTQFQIADEEAGELLPSGRVTVLQSRTHWARTYLSKAGLLTSPKRNLHVITDRGRAVLAQNPPKIDNAFLAQFEEFEAWRERATSGPGGTDHGEAAPAGQGAVPRGESAQTPEDAIAAADKVLRAALADELLALLAEVSPQRFERVILDLLAAMGFGRGELSNGHMTKTTGDGGIDGVIHEDALGLDAVYVQAKRYAPDNKISRPDIQRFVGSLTGEGATKGVFVTTSDFSREARDYISRVQHRIVLIDGQRFAHLLIKHGVGVRVRATYTIKTVDEDYFV